MQPGSPLRVVAPLGGIRSSHVFNSGDWLDLFLQTLLQISRLPMGVFAQPRLLPHQHLNKRLAVLVFLEFFKQRFLCFGHGTPMQCPSRLNLHTSMQGLGVLALDCFAMVTLRSGRAPSPGLAGFQRVIGKRRPDRQGCRSPQTRSYQRPARPQRALSSGSDPRAHSPRP